MFTHFIRFLLVWLTIFIFFLPLLHMQQEITAESSRGGIDIKRIYGEWTTSYLLIRNANVGDGGLYVCAPAGGSRTNIKVHVFQNGTNNYYYCCFHPNNNTNWQENEFFDNVFIHPIVFFFFFVFHVALGERPEAMQTGTSTYFADKGYIMHTLLVATIISIYNIFRDYYSSIIIERISIEDITWQTSTSIGLQRNFQWIWNVEQMKWATSEIMLSFIQSDTKNIPIKWTLNTHTHMETWTWVFGNSQNYDNIQTTTHIFY